MSDMGRRLFLKILGFGSGAAIVGPHIGSDVKHYTDLIPMMTIAV